jgi:hypothetical protein
MHERLELLEQRLALIESKLDQIFAKDAPPQAHPTQGSIASSTATLTQKRSSSLPPTKTAVSSTQWLPLIAVICFVLSGVFIIRLALESGWLTTERQWGLLTCLGLLLVSAGRWLNLMDQNYRSYLSAAGCIVLYMSAFSSSLYFDILSPTLSLLASVFVSGITLSLFHFHKTELFSVIASIGTYLSPLLIGSKEDLLFHAGFFVVWSGVFATMADYLNTRVLSVVSSYLALGIFTILHHNVSDSSQLIIVIAVQILQFSLFTGGVYHHSLRTKSPMSKELSMAYLPVLLFFYGTTYFFLNKLNPDLAPWISLVFAAIVYGLYRDAKKWVPLIQSENLVYGFLAVVIFHSGYMQILPEASKPWLLPLFILGDYLSRQRQAFPRLSPILKGFFALIGGIEFLSLCTNLITRSTLATVFPSVATITIGAFYYFKGRRWIADQTMILLYGLQLLTLLALYRVAYDWGSVAVTMAWGSYSLIILTIGYQSRDSALARSSLLVLLFTSLKALLYDASQAPSIVRIGSLLITGIILYVAGALFKRIKAWET